LTLEIRVLAGAGKTAWWRLSLPEVVEYTRQVIELSSQVDDPRTEFQARFYLARATTATGDTSAARQGLPYLPAMAEQLRDRSRIGDAISRNAAICFFTGDWEAALEICDRGLAHDAGSKAAMRSTRAMLDYERGASAEGWVHIEVPPPDWRASLENDKHWGCRWPPG